MHPREIRVTDPVEALVVEHALAMAHELLRVAAAAPDGQVLAETEQIAVTLGRQLSCKALEAVLNQQAQEAEKRGRAAGRVTAVERASTVDAARGQS